MRWKLTIEYHGTNFSGWQRQADQITVQQVLEESIHKFSGEEAVLHVAGRTDAGVHARAQVAHFDLAKDTNSDTVRDAINFHVKPHRVSVLQAESVSDEFHARFGALARSYRYQILNRRSPAALLTDFAWHVPKPLEIEPMQQAAKLLLGNHDFSTFRAQNCQSNSPVKTLDRLEVKTDGELIFFDTRARSFLYHQVRNMVGTLVMVGSGQWSIEDFQKSFEACDRKAGGPTAPAQGLFFEKVEY